MEHRVWMLHRDILSGSALTSSCQSTLGTAEKCCVGDIDVKNAIMFLWGFIKKSVKDMKTRPVGAPGEQQPDCVILLILSLSCLYADEYLGKHTVWGGTFVYQTVNE